MTIQEYVILLYVSSAEFYNQRIVFNSVDYNFNLDLTNTSYYEEYGMISVEVKFLLKDIGLKLNILELCSTICRDGLKYFDIVKFDVYLDLFFLTQKDNLFNSDINKYIISDKKYLQSEPLKPLQLYGDLRFDLYKINIDISKYKFLPTKYTVYYKEELETLLKISNKEDITLELCIRDATSPLLIKDFYMLKGFHSLIFYYDNKVEANSILKSLSLLEEVNIDTNNYKRIALIKYAFDVDMDGKTQIILGKSNSLLSYLLKYFDDIELLP